MEEVQNNNKKVLCTLAPITSRPCRPSTACLTTFVSAASSHRLPGTGPHWPEKQVNDLQTFTVPHLFQIQFSNLVPRWVANHLLWPPFLLCPHLQKITQIFSYHFLGTPSLCLSCQLCAGIPLGTCLPGKHIGDLQVFILLPLLQILHLILILSSLADCRL